MSVVEVTMFALRPGVEEAVFLALDRRVQTELVPNQPGFMRRTTARRQGSWMVVTLWSSEEAAAAFADAVEEEPVWLAFMDSIEPGSLVTRRVDTLD